MNFTCVGKTAEVWELFYLYAYVRLYRQDYEQWTEGGVIPAVIRRQYGKPRKNRRITSF